MKDIPISSECPKCGQERIQFGYDQDELVQALRTGGAIPAYCIACDEHWELSIEERADIARAVKR